MERRKFGFSPRRKDAIGFVSHWRLLGVTWTEISDRFHPSPQRVTRMEIEVSLGLLGWSEENLVSRQDAKTLLGLYIIGGFWV